MQTIERQLGRDSIGPLPRGGTACQLSIAGETKMTSSDHPNFEPFILTKASQPSLLLTGRGMALKTPIFEARGWLGGGYDWASIARVILVESLPDLADIIKFDPEADTFSAHGPREAMLRLGAEMLRVYKDDNILRDFLSRAQMD
jgi:hypothetical protein